MVRTDEVAPEEASLHAQVYSTEIEGTGHAGVGWEAGV